MRRSRSLVIGIICSMLCVACGYRGALYLPEKQAQSKAVGSIDSSVVSDLKDTAAPTRGGSVERFDHDLSDIKEGATLDPALVP